MDYAILRHLSIYLSALKMLFLIIAVSLIRRTILYAEKTAKYKAFIVITSCSGQYARALSTKLHPYSDNE